MSNNVIQEIKDKLSINMVMWYYLKNNKNIYWNHKYKCPFHGDWNEKTPSLYASDEKNHFYCFGCKEHWDIFHFVQNKDKNNILTFWEALEELKNDFAEELSWIDFSYKSKWFIYDAEYKKKQVIYELHEEMNEFMVSQLKTKRGYHILNYLKDNRKLSDETIEKFKIWVSFWRLVEDTLKEKIDKDERFKDVELKDTWFYSNKEGNLYFLFNERIMFPIYNNRKKIVWWSGWRIHDDQNPKYINSVNNLVYDKSANLFNFDKVKLLNTDTLYICEWNLDSTQLYNYGANNAVSLLWTNLTSTQIWLFKNKIKKVVLLLDNDEAGSKAVEKISKQLLQVWIIPFIFKINPHKDIDDYLKSKPELIWWIIEHIENGKKDILSEHLIGNYTKFKDKMNIEQRYFYLSMVKDMYEVIEDDIIKNIYKDILSESNIEFENLEKEYNESQKEEKKLEKQSDEINKKNIKLEDWDSEKKFIYIVYMINKWLITEDDISYINYNFYMLLRNSKVYNDFIGKESFSKVYPELAIEFDLINDEYVSEIIE